MKSYHLAVRFVNQPTPAAVAAALADDLVSFLRKEHAMDISEQRQADCPKLLKEARQAIDARQLRKAAELLNCAESEDNGQWHIAIETAWARYYDARR